MSTGASAICIKIMFVFWTILLIDIIIGYVERYIESWRIPEERRQGMVIKNAAVFEEDGSFTRRTLFTQQEWIGESGGGRVIDAENLYAVPGLVDIHFHGCAGHDFCEGNEKAIEKIAEYELSQGITSICPATMTVSTKQIAQICETAGNYHGKTGATLRGIHLEGPFISPEKKGAQKEEFILDPDAALLREWIRLGNGLCKLVDIAPERKGALDFITAVKKEIRVSLAHTTADYETAQEAFRRGASHITHLYNAMPAFSHRKPGVIGAGADWENVYAELICDGIHIHPAVIRATFKMYGEDRIVFVSDSIEATGLKDGNYQLGGQEVTVVGKEARLADGTIAGSVTNLMDCLRYAVKSAKIPLGAAVKCAAVNPAKSIGIYDTVGSLDKGKTADILLLNQNLDIVHLIHKGKIVYSRGQ